MSNEQPQPMTPEQWAEASTRGALLAQLRGQRGAGTLALTELRECREEYHTCRAMWAKQVRELSERAVVAEDAADDLRQENARLRELLDDLEADLAATRDDLNTARDDFRAVVKEHCRLRNEHNPNRWGRAMKEADDA